MSDLPLFQRKSHPTQEKKDIKTLFKDLKRAPHIKGLFGYQEKILEDYEKNHVNSKDIGLELPTGSGKKLVGLLIGEWRRYNLAQRVLYLCQTRQLANQVHKQSKDYGIDTRVLAGSKQNFDRNDLNLYRQSKTIVVSTYSALFNYNPEFQNPQTIILDDTHGSETYISSLWSLSVDRFDNSEIYDKIYQLFKNDLPANFINVIDSGRRELVRDRVDKLSFLQFYKKKQALTEIMDEYIDDKDADKDIKFPWLIIKDHIQACHMYISYDKILIRPYIAPTLTHTPFMKADQRICMSATLGKSGELERITGIRDIKKLEKPEIFKTRGIGQRFYIFPDYLQEPTQYVNWIIQKMSEKNRTLILCTSNQSVKNISSIISQKLPSKIILYAKDIEESLDPFIKKDNTVLILANRYDGIDIEDNACELIWLNGLPTGTNLQEIFLQERLNLDSLLKERILTRIQQASGRCTRNDNDKALIIMASSNLLDFCSKYENQKSFHPQIKGEIGLFFEVDPDSMGLIDKLINSFYSQDREWDNAQKIIADLRDEKNPIDTSVTDSLASCVNAEVDFAYDMWAGHFENAISRGRSVIDELSGPKLEQYRALWCYYTATPAIVLSEVDSKYELVTKEMINRARGAIKTNSWLPYAIRSMTHTKELETGSETTAIAVEGVLNKIKRLGTSGQRFYRTIDSIEISLKNKNADNFDSGLVNLGQLLGFTSFKPGGNAAPDAVWYLKDNLGIVFEGKSDEDPRNGVTVDNCTQTNRHLTWITSNEVMKNIKEVYSILVSPKKTRCHDTDAFGDVNFIHIDDVLSIFTRTKHFLIESKSKMIEGYEESDSNIILLNMLKDELTPQKILEKLTSVKVSDLPIE